MENGLCVVLRPNEVSKECDFERVLLPGMLQRRVFHRQLVQLLENGFVGDRLAAIDRIVAREEVQNQRARLLIKHLAAVENQLFVLASQLLQVVHQVRQAFRSVGCGEAGLGERREDLRDRLGVRRVRGRYELVFVVRRVESDQFGLHSRGSEEFLGIFEGAEVDAFEKRDDCLSVGANVRAKQNLQWEKRRIATLSISVKSARICDSSFRSVDKNPIALGGGLASPCSDSFVSFKLSSCCSLIYESTARLASDQ